MSSVLSQFWSLEYLLPVIPPFCISDKLTGIHIQLLGLLPAVYPLVLVTITCILMELHARNCRIIHILWKPFSVVLSKTNTTAVTGYAVIHPFASFILLSNNKFISTLALLGNDVFVRRCDGIIYKHTLIYDRSIEWFSQKHVLYSMIIAVPFVFLTLIPSILLAHKDIQQVSFKVSKC